MSTSAPPSSSNALHANARARQLLARGHALHDACDLGRALEAFENALNLDPTLVDARYMRAQMLENRDVAAALAEYDSLIRSEPEHLESRLRRAALRRILGNNIGALADYQAIDRLTSASFRPDPQIRRSLARGRASLYEEMGFLHGANAEYEVLLQQGASSRSRQGGSDDHLLMQRNSGRLNWKAGRYDDAAAAFSELVGASAGISGRAEPMALLWRHLCLARLEPARATEILLAAWPLPLNTFALRVSRSGASPAWEPSGPPCPTAKWPEPVIELFCGRIGPHTYLAMAAQALEISDQWQVPAAGPGVGMSELRPPAQHLWRAEVEFYLGQWHLLRGSARAARVHLDTAAADTRSRSFECYAAGAELARLATAQT